jgi:hypothetical protein
MAIQPAHTELSDPPVSHQPNPRLFETRDGDSIEDDGRTTAVRGIMTAVALSVPFWALTAFVVYLLL